jgi:hypothetical protein
MKFSNFKTFFSLNKQQKTLRIYLNRFSEKFFRDPWFRVKIVIPCITMSKKNNFSFYCADYLYTQ